MATAVDTGDASLSGSKHEGSGPPNALANLAIRYPMTMAFLVAVASGLSAETLPIPSPDIRGVVASIIAVGSYVIWRYSTSPDAPAAFDEEEPGPYPPGGVTAVAGVSHIRPATAETRDLS